MIDYCDLWLFSTDFFSKLRGEKIEHEGKSRKISGNKKAQKIILVSNNLLSIQ